MFLQGTVIIRSRILHDQDAVCRPFCEPGKIQFLKLSMKEAGQRETKYFHIGWGPLRALRARAKAQHLLVNGDHFLDVSFSARYRFPENDAFKDFPAAATDRGQSCAQSKPDDADLKHACSSAQFSHGG